ncbi:FMN reductase [Rhizobium sp. CNPSo 4039]|uniref:FMN reductase n=1 Tax=Rhizobium sp. CNPSo 4039 TaxID=3021409 RepID=UPI002551AE1D|nr:FMN reductase [Rhizobium sp. CNPSo 4039]MDK4717321.1 FMN reductase [Rhizobium sp. CNPSo 4039]
MTVLGISGAVRRPSRTTSLIDVITDGVETHLGGDVDRLDLVGAAPILFRALRADQLDADGRDIIRRVETADVLVVGSPVYRASYTGALKHLFDLVDYRALAGKSVILAATGGTPLHGLMIEHQLRPLFGFFGALTIPTSVYAIESDFTEYALVNPAIHQRIERAVEELRTFLPSARQSRDHKSYLARAIA